jgi:hypothetical protein
MARRTRSDTVSAHSRPARQAQPQELGRLVEGLAQSVVDGGAEPLVAADVVHEEELGVAARDQQQQIGRAQPLGEAHGERVCLQMIDAHQRALAHEGDRFRGRDADQEAADQAGSGRHRHRVETGKVDASLAHGLADDLVQAFHVCARGNLRHDAAVAAMLLPLRPHHVGKDASAAVHTALDDGGCRLVATRLDAEHQGVARVDGGLHAASIGDFVCT